MSTYRWRLLALALVIFAVSASVLIATRGVGATTRSQTFLPLVPVVAALPSGAPRPTSTATATPSATLTPTATAIPMSPAVWPMLHQDDRHTGQSASVGAQSANLAWRFFEGGKSTDEADDTSPVVGSDGTIYVGVSWPNGSLDALTPQGGLIWSFPTGEGVDAAPAIGPTGTIYVQAPLARCGSSCPSYLSAVTPDGTLQWSYLTGDTFGSAPTVGPDGTIYVGEGYYDTSTSSFSGSITALNPNGSVKWRIHEPNWTRRTT